MEMLLVNLTEQDLDWFVNVAAKNMTLEELKRPELLNTERHTLICRKMLEDGTGWIVKDKDQCIGALGSILVPHLFNPEYKTLAELFWYVLPEYRKSRAGYLLLKHFEYIAKEIADDYTLSILPDSPININTLNKMEWKLSEYTFRKVV